ncbi:3'-5' exonuclease [Bacteroidota bacterium]
MITNSFKNTISNEEINELPLVKFEGNIHIIQDSRVLKKALKILEKKKILGFDTETKPSFKKGKKNNVALLQLSTCKDAYLFRLNYMGLPEELACFLENHSIAKVGAAIKDDLKELQHLRKFEANNFIDLQKFVKDFGIENNGLKKMSAIILHKRISKSQQTSNWENNPLTQAQINYAATDAWICFEIYNKLISMNNHPVLIK